MLNNNKKEPESLEKTHTPSAIRKRLQFGVQHSYLKDFIYGAIDGAVTTFAVVSGVAGAGLSIKIVIILGLANLFGDGFSMAVGNFLGTRAEEQLREQARKEEEFHIQEIPQGEREEIRQIFAAKGFAGRELEKVVEVITADWSIGAAAKAAGIVGAGVVVVAVNAHACRVGEVHNSLAGNIDGHEPAQLAARSGHAVV